MGISYPDGSAVDIELIARNMKNDTVTVDVETNLVQNNWISVSVLNIDLLKQNSQIKPYE